MNTAIRKLTYHDIDKFKELIRVFEDVFEMKNFSMPYEDYLQSLLGRDDFGAFVAVSGKQVVGGLTFYVLQQYYSRRPLIYIYDIAVKAEFQRQGIGKMLISGIIGYCKETDMEEAFVQADQGDLPAIDFYRSTGGTEEPVVHFTYRPEQGLQNPLR